MKYRAEIDGLRAVAVVPVILYHAGFTLFSGGYVGVDVFFVISGYLISAMIMGEMEVGKFNLLTFYERRARRIFPALFFVILIFVPLFWMVLLPNYMASFSQGLVAISAFSSNILFFLTTDYFASSTELNPLIHTWSLAVEEQFYLLFPLLIILTWKSGKKFIFPILGLLFIISLSAAHSLSTTNPEAAFFLLHTRAWELLLGVFISFYFFSPLANKTNKTFSEIGGFLGLILILFAIFNFDEHTPFPSLYALIPTTGTALIIIFGGDGTKINLLLKNKLLVGIGLISYSAYLWHQPLFAFARHININEPSENIMRALAILTMFFAYLSWRYIETPFRNKQKFSRKQIFTISISLTICISAFGLFGHISKGFTNRLDAVPLSLSATNIDIFKHQVTPCWNAFEKSPNLNSACHLGAKNTPPSFALLGDSHASALAHETDQQAQKMNLTGLNYTYGICPPLKGINQVLPSDQDIICTKLRKDFFSGLVTNPKIPQTIIVNARWALLIERERFKNNEGGNEDGGDWVWDLNLENQTYAEAMGTAIIQSIHDILQSGRKVILVYPVPEMGWQVSERLAKLYLLKDTISEDDASTSFSRYIERNKQAIAVLDAIEENKNLIRIKPSDILCDSFLANRCVAHLNEHSLYFDDDHLSTDGAKLIVEEIMKNID